MKIWAHSASLSLTGLAKTVLVLLGDMMGDKMNTFLRKELELTSCSVTFHSRFSVMIYTNQGSFMMEIFYIQLQYPYIQLQYF
ncbi:unnamed protein product [Caenorhabditis nigoni]